MLIISPQMPEPVEASAESIRSVLDRLERFRLDGEPDDPDPFLMLAREKGAPTYMRAVCKEKGYLLEYQEGSTEDHYRAETLLPRAKVEEGLIRYAQGDHAYWQTLTEFQKCKPTDAWFLAGEGIGWVAGRVSNSMKSIIKEFKAGLKEGKDEER